MTERLMLHLHADDVHWDPRFALARLDDDEELLASVIELMWTVLNEHQSVLIRCIESKDFLGIRQLTHAHLPSLKILGFDTFAQVFEVFESVALMSDWNACEKMMHSIHEIWVKIMALLHRHIQVQA